MKLNKILAIILLTIGNLFLLGVILNIFFGGANTNTGPTLTATCVRNYNSIACKEYLSKGAFEITNFCLNLEKVANDEKVTIENDTIRQLSSQTTFVVPEIDDAYRKDLSGNNVKYDNSREEAGYLCINPINGGYESNSINEMFNKERDQKPWNDIIFYNQTAVIIALVVFTIDLIIGIISIFRFIKKKS